MRNLVAVALLTAGMPGLAMAQQHAADSIWGIQVSPGEVWRYKTRPADSASTLVIEAVGEREVHVCLRGVQLRGGRHPPADTTIVHLVVHGYYLRRSLVERVGTADSVAGCTAGHVAAKRDHTVAISTVRGLLTMMEERRWPSSDMPESDRRRCDLPALDLRAPDRMAVLCAEHFVVRNGYTAALGDASRMAYESIELGSDEDILEDRRGTLYPSGELLGCDATGCSVLFRPTAPENSCYGRVVTMDARFGALRMQHQDWILKSGSDAVQECYRRHQSRYGDE